MLDRLCDQLESSGLIPPGARVVVGYSGGADSTCMLHLLHALEIDLVAAHLHHGMRPEADDELERCEEFCQQLGVTFISGRADVPKISDDFGIGIEEAGRRARYAFFEQVKSQFDANLIATAHTRTDLAETVLFNLARGCGLAGASGIPAKNGDVIRPLLSFSRTETQKYCADLDLWTHDDPANTDIQFSRARIRHQIVPQLQQVNPRFEEAIARFAEIAEADDRFLDGAAAAALEQAEIPLNGEFDFLTFDCEIGFDRHKLAHLPDALARRAYRLAVSAVGAEIDHDQTVSLVERIRDSSDGSLTAEGGGVVVEWRNEMVHVRQLTPAEPFRFALTIPGETESLEFGWKLIASRISATPEQQKRAGLETILNPSEVKGGLYFRSAENGDSIEPFGFEGRRKVSDLLSETKLTLAARKRLPIICDMAGPIWIPGICLSNRVKLKEKAFDAICLRFESIRKITSGESETSNLNQTYAN